MGVAKKRGRPKIEIDKEQFESLCGLQCTKEEIAGFFKCSDDTVERWCKRTYDKNFAVVFKIYAQAGRISLRRYQFNLAKTSTGMAIWLGKQMLGQKEPEQALEITNKQAEEKFADVLDMWEKNRVDSK